MTYQRKISFEESLEMYDEDLQEINETEEEYGETLTPAQRSPSLLQNNLN